MKSLLLRGVMAAILVGSLAAAGSAQLSGDYTIDPQGSGSRNYTTFAAAITALKAGVSGPVRFTVASTTYKGPVQIGPVVGASATNTITFEAKGSPAIIDAAGRRDIGVFVTQKTEWIRLHNLRIVGWRDLGLAVDNGAQNNRFLRLVAETTATGPRHAVGLYGTDNNVLRFCVFRGGNTFVLYLSGFSDNNLIESCELDGRGQSKEVLHSDGTTGNIVKNSFLHDPAGWTCLNDQGNNTFVNNVIVASLNNNATVEYWDQNARGWNDAGTFKNNVVINLGSGPAIRYSFVDLGTPAPNVLDPLVSDRNCFYAPSSNGAVLVEGRTGSPRTVYFRGSLASFRSWQTKNPKYIVAGGPGGFDPNSIEGDPDLVSLKPPYDIHLNPKSPLIDKGTARIVESYQTQIPPHRVTHDLDGDVRGWKPDIGADEIAAQITGSGGTSPGSTHVLTLTAPRDGGHAYQVGSSFGTGPTRIGWRPLGLGVDNLLILTVGAQWPHVFPGYRGTLGATGNGQASIRLPQIPALIGQTIHSAFITSDPTAKLGIGAISSTCSLTVTK